MVQSRVAKDWDRRQALSAALDIFELNGVPLPMKEELLAVDEQSVVGHIMEQMPEVTKNQFETISQALQMLAKEVAVVRRALDGADEGTSTQEVCESSQDTPVMQALLKRAVIQAAKEVASIQNCHASWRWSTEQRIGRLMTASQLAEEATRDLKEVENTLECFAPTMKLRSRAFVGRMTDGQETALLQPILLAWRGEAKREKRVAAARDRFEKELADIEEKLVISKQRQVATVKGVLARGAEQETAYLLRTSLDEWKRSVDELKKERDMQKQLLELQEKLDEAQAQQAANSKKVMAKMGMESLEGLLSMCLQGWTLQTKEGKQERLLQGEVQKAAAEADVHAAARRKKSVAVLESMSGSSAAATLQLFVQLWHKQVKEDKKASEAKAAADAQKSKLACLTETHLKNARGVQSRISDDQDTFLLLRCFSSWNLPVRVDKLQRKMIQKIESKKRQLGGVQELFKTFATQLESGLGDDSQDSGRISMRLPGRHNAPVSGRGVPYPAQPSPKQRLHRPSGGKGGMQESVSLPNIHQRPGAVPAC
mmetsp:Transcript_41051/g.103085  ORF Transcript_41051/g.103085 Transcript_41051/m.103085 type:complete len:541 (+) Transcript_41051:1206-2828(+)